MQKDKESYLSKEYFHFSKSFKKSPFLPDSKVQN